MEGSSTGRILILLTLLLFSPAPDCRGGTIFFETSFLTLREDSGPTVFKILREESGSSLSLRYQLFFNSSDPFSDFEVTSGTALFASDGLETQISLHPSRDGLVEGTELFQIILSDPSNGATITTSTVRLLDEQIPAGRDHSFTNAIQNPFHILELPDSSVLLVGVYEPGNLFPVMRRLQSNGEFVPNWRGEGRYIQAITDAFIYPDHSMLLIGRFDFPQGPFQRLRPDGSTDHDWTVPLGTVIGFQRDGKFIGLNDRLEVVRYSIDKTPDPTFNSFNLEDFSQGTILADDSILLLRAPSGAQPFLALYDSTGRPVPLVGPIFSPSRVLALSGGGFAALVRESAAQNAAFGLGIFDLAGNRKSFNPVRGFPFLARFGQGLTLSGSEIGYGGREGDLLFVNPEGQVLVSIVPMFASPLTVWPGGKLLAPYPLPRSDPRSPQQWAMGRFHFPNASISEIEFSSPEYNLPEGARTQLTLRRRGDTSQPATFAVRLESGQPLNGLPEIIRFEPLQTELSLEISSEPNPLPETDQHLDLVLTNLSAAVPGELATTLLRILDDDGRPGSIMNDSPDHWYLDPSFTPVWSGMDISSVRAISKAPDGRFYVAGQKNGAAALVAFTPDGYLDHTFPPRSVGAVFTLASQSDGKLLVGGEIRSLLGQPVNSIARLTPDGAFDSTFRGLTASAHGVYTVVVQPDQKILVGGLLTDPSGNALVRLLKDGQNDPNFSLAPHKFGYVTRIALQADGKILFAFARNSLNNDFVVARVHPTGALDPTFEPQRGPIPSPFTPHALAVQQDGKILMGLGAELRRLTANGAPDPEFNLAAQPNGLVSDIEILQGGKLLVAGTFTRIGGLPRGGLARLNLDGSVDPHFDPGLGAEILHLLPLSNGHYLAGGNFQTFNLQPVTNLVQILATTQPRFIFWRKPGGLETWFTANPGDRVQIEQSSDLQSWFLHETKTLIDFTAQLTPATATSNIFLRGKLE